MLNVISLGASIAISILVIIIFILLILAIFFVYKKKNKSDKPTIADESLNDYYYSQEFSDLYYLAMQNIEANYRNLENEEDYDFYKTQLSLSKIKNYDNLVDIFNKQSKLYLERKINQDVYLNIIEAYIFVEGYLKKNMIESIVDENNLFAEDLNNNEIYDQENNSQKSNAIELLDDEYFREFDNRLTNIIHAKNDSSTTLSPKPKFNSFYKPTRSVVLHVDQIINDMEEIVLKMSTEEQLKYLDDFFN